ncbi:ribosomal protein S18-alanine N-acetyltransferase [Marinobacter mobilis]|uniref:Ribosomal-protein-alanine acetyltransferase n=1 Tax=Marinobacter mobilis TaxID=488533 RepID=A0A1H2Z9A4_9GAMM|nr:ribosomal protein S18-alanine N-acetyltransferase [Marinobacter mobilis]SDX13916.1 ribosomal-protein-alanine acetyltransferase [Marinobacter mobilis]
MAQIHIRPALRSDLDALTQLESQLFTSDQISRRSFRRFISMPRDRLLVAMRDQELIGYCLVFMHAATRLARIYSIGVHPDARGHGVGESLLHEAEALARQDGRIVMRLEVRKDNPAAIRLYQRLGYRQFGSYSDYYEDHSEALRFERRILFYERFDTFPKVPYYAQTTEFTCGPAALMMAMVSLDPEQEISSLEELRIWREATTIFMLAGHGGCGPHGLALAAWKRGFEVSAYVSQSGPLFQQTVRDENKKRVLELVHEGFMHDIGHTGIQLIHESLTLEQLQSALSAGQIPLILISSWQLSQSRVPHWVTVTAIDDRFVYLNDPEVDYTEGESIAAKQYVPVDRQIFDRMQQYGRSTPLKAAVVIGPKRAD